MSKNDYSESFQEYLEIIYRLSQDAGAEVWISNSSIADSMSIKPPSVTEMLSKLQDKGLLIWKKRKGVKLTEDGEKVGKSMLDVHRLLEDFFSVVLELDEESDEDLKHRVACDLEHHLVSEPKFMEAMKKSIERAKKQA